jgi:multidrug efflux pump subunit AcrA (membrane-fusion protein)
VSYIDPQVNPDTRTAKLRIEVVNRSQQLRLGLYVEVSVSGVASSGVLVVPRTALQTVGDRQVVYLADPKQPGKFVEREVRIGNAFGKDVEVISGVMAGDLVVTEGSFALRAERERLGLRISSAGYHEDAKNTKAHEVVAPETLRIPFRHS